jgi:hypothetical protein
MQAYLQDLPLLLWRFLVCNHLHRHQYVSERYTIFFVDRAVYESTYSTPICCKINKSEQTPQQLNIFCT